MGITPMQVFMKWVKDEKEKKTRGETGMIELKLLAPDDREQFIKDNQEAFNYSALEEFGI